LFLGDCSPVSDRGLLLSKELIEWDTFYYPKKKIQSLHSDTDLLKFLSRRTINYSCIKQCFDILKQISPRSSPVKYNVFIPCGGRAVNIFFTLLSFLNAVNQRTDIRIIIIEIDKFPYMQQLTNELSIDYMFIHPNISILIGCAGLYPKSLAYNLAFLHVPEADWNIFHDADINVPLDFF